MCRTSHRRRNRETIRNHVCRHDCESFHTTIYKRATYVEEACERRMVECSEEDYNYVLGQATAFIKKMEEYNTKVFKHLWVNKDCDNSASNKTEN